MTHGLTAWDLNDHKPAFGELFNQGMVCDSSFVMDIVVKECGDVFRGLSSLVDVAGGLGAAALAISTAFPHVQCSVLDLPHVAANAPANTSVKYIAGDMFESIPPADAVFLKVHHPLLVWLFNGFFYGGALDFGGVLSFTFSRVFLLSFTPPVL
jgi:hypothetical protein